VTILILGLLLFLGVHSVRILADGWRSRTMARIGERPWKGLYTLVSLVGFALIVWGYGLARAQPVQLWSPPPAMRHVSALLTAIAFILLAAAYVPGNGIKSRLHHPMVLSVQVWALAHLMATGNVAHVVLFGSFLLWAVLNFRAARQRDRLAGTVYAAGRPSATIMAIAIGLLAWALFAFWLHGLLIGIRPLG